MVGLREFELLFLYYVISLQIFQLCLDEEVLSDKSVAQRSTTTGHLVITMPKAKAALRPAKPAAPSAPSAPKVKSKQNEKLEVDPSKHKMPDIGNIVSEKGYVPPLGTKTKSVVKERENSPDFVDDPDVPPLI